MSLRDQFANWSWQSASQEGTGSHAPPGSERQGAPHVIARLALQAVAIRTSEENGFPRPSGARNDRETTPNGIIEQLLQKN